MYKKIENKVNDIIKLKISKTSLDKFNLYLIIFTILSMMIPRIIYNFTSIYNDYLYNYYLILIIPLGYIFIHNIKNGYHKATADFILLSIFMLIALISSMHAFNPWMAFLGDSGRKTGYVTYIIYYLIYINSKNINNEEDIFKILKVIFIIGIINTIFALGQVYIPYNNIANKMYVAMGYGLMGNPNFLATFALLLTSLALYISIFMKKSKFYMVTTFIMFICLTLASSTGPFITFVLMLAILFIYIVFKRKDLIKKVMIYILSFIVLFTLVEYTSIYVNKNIYKYYIEDTSTISGDISNIVSVLINKVRPEDVISNPNNYYSSFLLEDEKTTYNQTDAINYTSSGRLLVYKYVLEYIDYGNYIWLGTGPDNMHIYHINKTSINDHALMSEYDKAHNVYLNILAETGIFSLIIYMAWIIYYHIKTVNLRNDVMYLLLFGLISYNIQGLLNIDVFIVMPYYFIIAGMLIGMGDKLESKKH